MKLLTTIGLLAVSFSSFAFERSLNLDLTNLYSVNGGTYNIEVKISPKKTISQGKVTTQLNRNDMDFTCSTNATFEVGEMNFSIAHEQSDWKKTITQKVYASVSNIVDGTECDMDLAKLAGSAPLYAQVSLNNGSIPMPIKAPQGHDSVQAWLTPFAGYLYVEGDVKLNGKTLTIDPSRVLTEENIARSSTNNNVSKFYYYVQAVKGSSILSLGTAEVNF